MYTKNYTKGIKIRVRYSFIDPTIFKIDDVNSPSVGLKVS